MIAEIERLLRALAIERVTSAAGTVNTVVDATLPYPTAGAYWIGRVLVMLSGVARGQTTVIVADDAAGTLTVRPAFSAAPGANQVYLILKQVGDIVAVASTAENYTPSQNIGNKADAAALDNMTDITDRSIQARLRLLLTRMAPNAFAATVNGNADTALDDMIAHLAAYFVALGALYAATINPGAGDAESVEVSFEHLGNMLAGATGIVTFPGAANIGNGVSLAEAIRAILTSMVAGDDYDAYTNINAVARASVNACFQGLASVLGADAGNVFNPLIQGVAQTDLDAALYNMALYFNALGAALSVTMNPGAGARNTLQLILQDLADMLAGGTGIVTFPTPRALPANGVSLAEVERYIAELKPHFSTPTAATHTTASADPTEDTAFTTAAIGPGLLHAVIFLNALVAGDDITFRVYQYNSVGAAYQLLSEQQFVGAPTLKVYTLSGLYVDATAHIQLRTLRTSATNRAFPYRYSIYQQPVV